MSRLTRGRVLALSVAYLLIGCLAGPLLFLQRLHNDAALHRPSGASPALFMAIWTVVTFGPPILGVVIYSRRQGGQV